MKLIIAGSRTITLTVEELDILINDNFDKNLITEIVSGCAKGVDTVGIQWANLHGILIKKFIPDWSIGKAAGHIRNREMGNYADAAIVIHNGSPGSLGMINCMNKLNKKCVSVNMA